MGRHCVRWAAVLLALCSFGVGVSADADAPDSATGRLAGSRLSAREAAADPDFVYSVVLEALEDVAAPQPGELWVVRQRVKPADLILGTYPYAESFDLVYRLDPDVRPMRKGERVIWLTRGLRRTNDVYSCEGLKALPDTPANQRVVIDAVNARLSERGSESREKVRLLRQQIAAAEDPEARAALGLVLGKTLMDVCRDELGWSRPRKDAKDDPLQLKVHEARAKEAQAQAIATMRGIWQESPDSASAPEALFHLGSLYWDVEKYSECADACRALLAKYPDAEFSCLLWGRHQFNVNLRLGGALAALGRRKEATDAFVASLLAAKTEVYWKSGMRTLLRYEPRLTAPECRRDLPEAAQAALQKAEREAEVVIELTAEAATVVANEPIEIGYRVENRGGLPAPNPYGLEFGTFPADREEPAGRMQRGSTDRTIGATDALAFEAGPVAEGRFTIREGLPEGRHVVSCEVAYVQLHSFGFAVPHNASALCWVKPVIVAVVRPDGVAALPVEPPAAAHDAGRQAPLHAVLASRDRWELLEGLETWDRALTEQERQHLTTFARDNEGRDWLLQYRAHTVLKEHGGEARSVAPELAQAEVILAQLGPSKASRVRDDSRALDIVMLGNATVPLLLGMLSYRGEWDEYRKCIAIQALARLEDDRIVPALKAAVAVEGDPEQLQQELLALLCHGGGDEMADYVAAVVAGRKGGFEQEHTVSFLAWSGLHRQTKARVFSHYAEFDAFGKRGVIEDLRRQDDAEAFAELCRILQLHDEAFHTAARALGRLRNSDPCAALLEALPTMADGAADDVIRVLAEKGYVPAAGELQRRRDEAGDDALGRRTRLLAAAALCRMDTDYDRSAAIVREGLRDDRLRAQAFAVVDWLHDEETTKVLISLLDDHLAGPSAALALSRVGSKSAVPVLMAALHTTRIEEFGTIGRALVAIGRKNNDQALVDYGQEVSKVGMVLFGALGWYQPEGLAGPIPHGWESTGAWLAAHPDVTASLLRPRSGNGYRPDVDVDFLESVWNPELVPIVEEMIRTDDAKMDVHTSHGIVP